MIFRKLPVNVWTWAFSFATVSLVGNVTSYFCLLYTTLKSTVSTGSWSLGFMESVGKIAISIH